MVLDIDTVQFTLAGADFFHHRAGPIARRAFAIVQLLLAERLRDAGLDGASRSWQELAVLPVTVDFATMSDEQIARRVAEAIVGTLAARTG